MHRTQIRQISGLFLALAIIVTLVPEAWAGDWCCKPGQDQGAHGQTQNQKLQLQKGLNSPNTQYNLNGQNNLSNQKLLQTDKLLMSPQGKQGK